MKKYRCLNIGNCKIAGTKETFEISEGEDLVCPKCGSTLVAEVSGKKHLPLVIVCVLALCVLGGGGYALLGRHGSSPILSNDSTFVDSLSLVIDTTKIDIDTTTVDIDTTTVDIDTTKIDIDSMKIETELAQFSDSLTVDTLGIEESTTSTPSASVAEGIGKLKLSYGRYMGAILNGYPHGLGRLTYTKTRQINRNDIKGRTANVGDYVIGEFFNGFVVYGKHYDSAGNLLGTLNFGVGSEDSYESK